MRRRSTIFGSWYDDDDGGPYWWVVLGEVLFCLAIAAFTGMLLAGIVTAVRVIR